MSSSIRFRIAAGPRVYPWAARLAESWRQLGFRVLLKKDGRGPADRVRLYVGDGRTFAISTLFFDRRVREIVGGFTYVREAAQRLRAGELVDLPALVERTADEMEDLALRGEMWRCRNTIRTVEHWLEKKSRAALLALAWHLAEVYPFVSPHSKKSLLAEECEDLSRLRRLEARRLILEARSSLIEWLKIGKARRLLSQAAPLVAESGDETLALRIALLRAAALVEKAEGESRSGFHRLARIRRRAEELGDGPLYFEIMQTIAYLESWWFGNENALRVLEEAASFAAACGLWTPPRLEHLRRLYRALVNPCRETMEPMVTELFALLDRGDLSCSEGLNHFRLVKESLGEHGFAELLAPFFGERNAWSLAKATKNAIRDDEERRIWFEERENERERGSLRAASPLRIPPPGG